MSKQLQQERPLINALKTDKEDVYLLSGQTIYETPKTYELWQTNPLRFIRRFRKANVHWLLIEVGLKEEWYPA